MTQYHQVPTSTASYWPSTTKYHPVPPFFDPVPSYINVPRDNVLCDNVPYDIVPCNIVPRDNCSSGQFFLATFSITDQNRKKRIIIQIRDLHCLLGLVFLKFIFSIRHEVVLDFEVWVKENFVSLSSTARLRWLRVSWKYNINGKMKMLKVATLQLV